MTAGLEITGLNLDFLDCESQVVTLTPGMDCESQVVTLITWTFLVCAGLMSGGLGITGRNLDFWRPFSLRY